MTDSSLLDSEARLAADHDGSYRAQLIETLRKHQNEIALAVQGFLPPEQYEAAEHLILSLEAAISVLVDYQVQSEDPSPEPSACPFIVP
jgi:hypothetical protein